MKKHVRRYFLLLGLSLVSLARADDAPAPASTVDVVFIGDSITAGAGVSNAATQAAPVLAGQDLQELLGPGAAVYLSNQGHSGYTTVNFLPGSADLAGAETAARQLQTSHPGPLVFSFMLGTNDSANHGPAGAPVSPDDYAHNLRQIIDKLLSDFPNAKFVLNDPLWYSPNTHNNGADYEGADAAARVKGYFAAIDSVVAAYASASPNHVFAGDNLAYDYFALHYQSELNAENGRNGTFFLHPNVKGAQSLGKFWADALFKILQPG